MSTTKASSGLPQLLRLLLVVLALGVSAVAPSSTRGVNYASAYLGAKIVDHHPLAVGAQNLLKEDPEKYMIVPCRAERKTFTFGLSKEIEVHALSLHNLEYFSSSIRNFTLLGSRTYPCKLPGCSWRVLGAFAAKPSRTVQHFNVPRKPPVRFVRVLWVTHQGMEQSCTLTSIQVFGSDVLEALVAELADQYEEQQQQQEQEHHHHHHEQQHQQQSHQASLSSGGIGGGGGGGPNGRHMPPEDAAVLLASGSAAGTAAGSSEATSTFASMGSVAAGASGGVGAGHSYTASHHHHHAHHHHPVPPPPLPPFLRSYLAAHPFSSPACNGTWCVALLMRAQTCPVPKPKSAPLTVLNRQLHALQTDISRLQKRQAEQRAQFEHLKTTYAARHVHLDGNVTALLQTLAETQRRLAAVEYELAAVKDVAEATSGVTPQLVTWIVVANALAMMALISVVSGRISALEGLTEPTGSSSSSRHKRDVAST